MRNFSNGIKRVACCRGMVLKQCRSKEHIDSMCYIFIQLSKFQMLRPPSSQQPHRPTPTPPPPPPTVSRLSADAPVFSPCFEVETATCSRRRIKGRENMGKQEFKTIEGTHITSHIFIYFYIHILYIECIVHAVQSDKW